MDPIGRLTSYGYDAADHVVSMTDALGNMSRWIYDKAGNPLVENANGSLTTTVYNGSNRELNIQYPKGAISTYAYAGDGLRRTLQDTGAPFTFTVWDGSDYLQERS